MSCYNCRVAIVVLQLPFCNYRSAIVVLQLSFYNCRFAAVVLRLSFCDCRFAIVVLQALQLSFCNSRFATDGLQLSFSNCRFAIVVLQLSFCNCKATIDKQQALKQILKHSADPPRAFFKTIRKCIETQIRGTPASTTVLFQELLRTLIGYAYHSGNTPLHRDPKEQELRIPPRILLSTLWSRTLCKGFF